MDRDPKDAFLQQPNLSVSRSSPALLSSPYLAPEMRVSKTSSFILPILEVAISRPSTCDSPSPSKDLLSVSVLPTLSILSTGPSFSSYSSWSSGGDSSVRAVPLFFPGVSNPTVWSPHATNSPYRSPTSEVPTSFRLKYNDQGVIPPDSALFYTRQKFGGTLLPSTCPRPPPSPTPPPKPGPEHLHLCSALPALSPEDDEKVKAVKLCGLDSGSASLAIRQASEEVRASRTFSTTCSLGMGTSAPVARANHAGKRYAVKVIDKDATDASGRTRGDYLRELEVFRRVSQTSGTHQSLSTLRTSWKDVVQGRSFVTDLYPTDLFYVLSRGMPITMRDRQRYCKELINAVSALRGLAIVHRDIKPSNVHINAHGREVLSLSDISKADASACADSYEFWRCYTPSGTPPYMAPEVAAADVQEKGYGPSADVWSLGPVFLEIFRKFPSAYFNALTVEDIRREHVKLGRKGIDLERVCLLEVPRCLEILVESMLQYYEELRPTVEELGEWNARPNCWEISPGASNDWVPLVESRGTDRSDLGQPSVTVQARRDYLETRTL